MWVIMGIRFEDIDAVFQACERMCPSRLNDAPIVSKNLTLCKQWMPDKQMVRFSGFLTFSPLNGVPRRRFATSRTKVVIQGVKLRASFQISIFLT